MPRAAASLRKRLYSRIVIVFCITIEELSNEILTSNWSDGGLFCLCAITTAAPTLHLGSVDCSWLLLWPQFRVWFSSHQLSLTHNICWWVTSSSLGLFTLLITNWFFRPHSQKLDFLRLYLWMFTLITVLMCGYITLCFFCIACVSILVRMNYADIQS